MRTKKYWQKQSEEHYRDLQKARNEVDLKDQALVFLLDSPETYRVKLTSDVQFINAAPYSTPSTRFEYVDQNGKYHRHYRPVSIDALEVISTNAETAVLRFETVKNKYTYWILNKADETIAEIPEDYFCHRGTKICEVKETNDGSNESNA